MAAVLTGETGTSGDATVVLSAGLSAMGVLASRGIEVRDGTSTLRGVVGTAGSGLGGGEATFPGGQLLTPPAWIVPHHAQKAGSDFGGGDGGRVTTGSIAWGLTGFSAGFWGITGDGFSGATVSGGSGALS